MTLARYQVQCRSKIEGDTLFGHAAVFNQATTIYDYREQLAPTAFNDVLDRSGLDVAALINHDPSFLLGRTSSGTLRLKVDSEGLVFEVDLPDTSAARDLRTLVARGDMTGASFGFIPGDYEWSETPDGKQLLTHTRINELRDVSPVTFPAYKGTDVDLRNLTDRPDARSQLIRARARVRLEKND